tara:strand:- start:20 stop:472 length:453 start_codon:yes stop_codon:yes gene_type:complete
MTTVTTTNGIVMKSVSNRRFYDVYGWVSEYLPDELPSITFLLREPDPSNLTAKRDSLARKVTRQVVIPASTAEKIDIKLAEWLKDTSEEHRKSRHYCEHNLYAPMYETLYWFRWNLETLMGKDHISTKEHVNRVTREARRGYQPYKIWKG